MSMISKWPVRLELPVGADDADGDGRLTRAAGERLFTAARDAYLATCRTFDGGAVEVKDLTIVPGGTPAPVPEPGVVSVSVNVIEIFPDRFTMSMRVRAEGADGVVADGTCDVLPAGGLVTDEIRDELIAHAHGAQHYH